MWKQKNIERLGCCLEDQNVDFKICEENAENIILSEAIDWQKLCTKSQTEMPMLL